MYWIGSGTGEIPPASVDFAALSPEARADIAARGEEVFHAGDCAACHSDPATGAELAGGVEMVTPMGALYGSNISRSKEHGIGDWTPDEFYAAVARGIAPGRVNLYPAMPYASYHRVTRADSDAMWLWIMDQPPIEKPSRPNEMTFPFNIRPALALWNAIERPEPEPEIDQGTEKGRGEYLVTVLGHCGECHTPRNALFAVDDGKALQGNVLEGALAPDITPDALAARGWTKDDLVRFFGTGLAPQGVMTFRMYPVLEHSTSQLGEEDLAAMATYLTGDREMPGPVAKPPVGQTSEAGEALYLGLCSGCHGVDGLGQPHSSMPMATNTTAMLPSALNLTRVIHDGIPEQELAGGERMQAMPGFGDKLSDEETAQLVNYLRQRWGGREGDVTAGDVADYLETITHGGG